METEFDIKTLIIIVLIGAVGALSSRLYTYKNKFIELEQNFNDYKLETDNLLSGFNKDNQNEPYNDEHIDYQPEIVDGEYGSCGVALSETFLDMVVDWREDPVYNPEVNTAYLTFDDGPSDRTTEILDILDQYNIKATFFTIGTKNVENQELYKEIVDRGHTLGMHSYSHKYDGIYNSRDAFLADFYEIFSTIKDKTGSVPVLFRYPGGSNNRKMEEYGTEDSIKSEMEARGFIYYDWNVSGEDAVYKNISANDIAYNVLSGAKGKHRAVILLHDASSKYSTVEALPTIIEGLNEQGFVFDKLSPDLSPVQFNS